MSLSQTRVLVDLGDAAHEVRIGPDALAALPDVPWPPGARRAAVVTDVAVGELYGRRVADLVGQAGLDVEVVTVPEGEGAKSLEVLGALYADLARLPLGRNDVVVALGGGVVGDLAGFAAATWNRGVAVVQVPTTLLAQVDSAVGGKTGINLPQGKNLVGSFHQPIAVVADTAVLGTLPERDLRAGLGEVAKYGFIADPEVLELLETRGDAAAAGDPAVLAEIVRRGVAVKAAVVAADERESDRRLLLNYGHTVAHAVETLTGYGTYRHGEAVALGLVAAARLGERVGVSEPGLADRTVALLRRLGLPVGGVDLDPDAAWEVMARDKKATAEGVRFVLCRTPGDALVPPPPPRADVLAVVRSLRD